MASTGKRNKTQEAPHFVSLVVLGSSLLAGPASAVVYCKTDGAPGVAPANRGGPVNRPGVR